MLIAFFYMDRSSDLLVIYLLKHFDSSILLTETGARLGLFAAHRYIVHIKMHAGYQISNLPGTHVSKFPAN